MRRIIDLLSYEWKKSSNPVPPISFFIAVLVSTVAIFLIVGCDGDYVSNNTTEATGQKVVFTNTVGQELIEVPTGELVSWLNKNNTKRIISISPLARLHGGDKMILVLYEKTAPEKCTSCGQPIPCEKK